MHWDLIVPDHMLRWTGTPTHTLHQNNILRKANRVDGPCALNGSFPGHFFQTLWTKMRKRRNKKIDDTTSTAEVMWFTVNCGDASCGGHPFCLQPVLSLWVLLAAFSRTAHPNDVVLSTALPWLLSNTWAASTRIWLAVDKMAIYNSWPL